MKTTLEQIRKSMNNPFGLENLEEFQAKRNVSMPLRNNEGVYTEPLILKDGERLIGQITEGVDNDQPTNMRHWMVKLIDGNCVMLKCVDFAKVPSHAHSTRFLSIVNNSVI